MKLEFFATVLHDQVFGIDEDEMGFSGVSLMTIGEIKGHGRKATMATLESILEVVRDKTVPAYLTHLNAESDRLGREIGVFRNFRIFEDSLRGDFRFLTSWAESAVATKAKLIEMAKNDASLFGTSIVGWAKDAKGVAIFEDVLSFDFVTQPAANNSLFRTNKHKPKMEIKEIFQKYSEHKPELVNALVRFATDNEGADESAVHGEFQRIKLEDLSKQADDLKASAEALEAEKAELSNQLQEAQAKVSELNSRIETLSKGREGKRTGGEENQPDVLEKYTSLSGKERQDFYLKNRSAIIAAQKR